MPGREPNYRDLAAKRAREIRVIQTIMGAVAGAIGGGLYLGTIGVIGGIIIGAVAAYYTPLWRSGLD